MNTLFPIAAPPSQTVDAAQSQYLTPEWAALELVSDFYPDLTTSDLVLEPSCGRGAFLKAVPDEVPAIGIEIDPVLADEARHNTGRRILCGDFRTIDIDFAPTLVLGNPPFKVKLIEQFLERCHNLLPNNGRCGFLLSTHMVQTPNTVLRWNERWSLDQRIVPRTLFPRAIRPLIFLMFRKDREKRLMGGFSLYRAAAEISLMSSRIRLLLINGQPRQTCWRAVVDYALRLLGGRATVKDLYHVIEPRRHTDNPWWKEKVRQTLQRYFRPIDRGVWALPEVMS